MMFDSQRIITEVNRMWLTQPYSAAPMWEQHTYSNPRGFKELASFWANKPAFDLDLYSLEKCAWSALNLFPQKEEPAVLANSFAAAFLFSIDYFLALLVLALLVKNFLASIFEESLIEIIRFFQRYVSLQYLSQIRIKDKVKTIFVPLKMILNSLRPIEIAA